MNAKNFAIGVGAFVGGLATLTGAAVLADRFAARRDEHDEDEASALAKVDASGEPAAKPPVTSPEIDRAPSGGEACAFGAVDASNDHTRATNDPLTAAPAGSSAEHVPTDLMGDARPGDGRAPAAFRPDIDAPMTPAEREALRPATGPGPSLVSGIPNVAEETVRPAN